MLILFKEFLFMTNEKIFIIAQGFYGNRTATEINKNEVDSFLSGFLSPELFSERNNPENIRKLKAA